MTMISLRNTEIVLHTRWKKKCGEKTRESFLRPTQSESLLLNYHMTF